MAVAAAGAALTGCDFPATGHLSTCDDSTCGGNKAVMWAMTSTVQGPQPSFTFSFERNGQTFPEKTLSSDTHTCDAQGDYAVCLSVEAPGGICGPELARVEGTSPALCMSVGIDGRRLSLVDGDDYHLVVKYAGRTIADDHWVATYTDREPEPGVCNNSNDVRCRFADHRFTVQQ